MASNPPSGEKFRRLATFRTESHYSYLVMCCLQLTGRGGIVIAAPSAFWNVQANRSLEDTMSERDQPKPEDAKDMHVQPDLATTIPGGDVVLEPELQAFIGRQLQASYDEILNEPVPGRLLELLQKLEQGKAD